MGTKIDSKLTTALAQRLTKFTKLATKTFNLVLYRRLAARFDSIGLHTFDIYLHAS